MTQNEHITQHHKGELGCLIHHANDKFQAFMNLHPNLQPPAAKAFFDEQVHLHVDRWKRTSADEVD